jgi:polysaccharide export outer membrane protein
VKTVHVVNDKGSSNEKYKIKINDVLSIRNIQDENFLSTISEAKTTGSNIFRVEDNGTAILPVIGAVAVLDLTRQEASDKIQSLYKKQLLKNPIIELTILNLKVTLLGEFSMQGNFLLERENTTLIDVIGMAGGISSKANPKTLKIIRGDRANPEIIYVNLRNINSLANPKLILQNNDIIYLEPLSIYNTSERLQSASIVLQPLLLLISSTLVVLNFAK